MQERFLKRPTSANQICDTEVKEYEWTSTAPLVRPSMAYELYSSPA